MAMPSVMTWLAAGVPLTLICDLVGTQPPDSVAINAVERPAGDPVWAEGAAAATAAEWWRTA